MYHSFSVKVFLNKKQVSLARKGKANKQSNCPYLLGVDLQKVQVHHDVPEEIIQGRLYLESNLTRNNPRLKIRNRASIDHPKLEEIFEGKTWFRLLKWTKPEDLSKSPPSVDSFFCRYSHSSAVLILYTNISPSAEPSFAAISTEVKLLGFSSVLYCFIAK